MKWCGVSFLAGRLLQGFFFLLTFADELLTGVLLTFSPEVMPCQRVFWVE